MDTSVERARRADRVIVAAAAVAVVGLAIAVLVPLWVPLAFAVWTAALLEPLAAPVAAKLRSRRVAAALGVALVLALLAPLGIVVAVVVRSAADLAKQLAESPAARQALETLVSDGSTNGAPLENQFLLLIRQHGATSWEAARRVAGAGATAVLAVLVFFVVLYELLARGRETWSWIVRHAPVSEKTSQRLGRAFIETGRGLLIGAGLTALVQAVLAGVAYAALGVPRAIPLAAITYVCAFVPAVGTAVVWGPVAVGFALKGDLVRAGVMAAVGAIGVSSIDNVVRPLLQRWGGKLDLPAWVLLLAAFGGLAAFGPTGLLLGPLALRIAREVLAIAREARDGEADAVGT